MTDAADSHARSMVLFCNIAVSFHPTGGVKSLWPPPCPLSFQPGRGNLHISPEGDGREGWEWHRPDHGGGETWWVHLVRSRSGVAGSAQQGLDPETLRPQHGQSQMACPALKQSGIPKLRAVETRCSTKTSPAHTETWTSPAQTERQKLREGRACSASHSRCVRARPLGPCASTLSSVCGWCQRAQGAVGIWAQE